MFANSNNNLQSYIVNRYANSQLSPNVSSGMSQLQPNISHNMLTLDKGSNANNNIDLNSLNGMNGRSRNSSFMGG